MTHRIGHESRIDALLDGKKALGALPFDDFGEQRALFTLNDEIAVDKSVPDLFGKQDARRTFPRRRHPDENKVVHTMSYYIARAKKSQSHGTSVIKGYEFFSFSHTYLRNWLEKTCILIADMV